MWPNGGDTERTRSGWASIGFDPLCHPGVTASDPSRLDDAPGRPALDIEDRTEEELPAAPARRAHTNGGFDPSLLTRRRAARRTISGAGSPPPSVPAGVGTGRPAEMCWVLPRAVPPRRPPTGRAPACRAHHPVRDSSTHDLVPSPRGAPTSSTPLDFWCHKWVRRGRYGLDPPCCSRPFHPGSTHRP